MSHKGQKQGIFSADGGSLTQIKIHNKLVGEGEPIFVIAEGGVNHNGSVALATQLIDAALEAGADAIKFQTFKADKIVSRRADTTRHQKGKSDSPTSQYKLLKRLELTDGDLRSLFRYAREREIICLSSPYDESSVDLLDELNVPAYKIGSSEITNLPLLQYIASKKRPIILSSGMATLGEIEGALNTMTAEGARDVILMHCVSEYPAATKDLNLQLIRTLRETFKIPTGFSDHTLSTNIPIAAVACGACALEKHLTLDTNLPGPDHKASLNPVDFKQMVENIRSGEAALGDGVKRLTPGELEAQALLRTSLTAKRFISARTRITRDMIEIKRPGTGIQPKYVASIIGKTAIRDIEQDTTITWEIIGY